jgi:hypothetical protein
MVTKMQNTASEGGGFRYQALKASDMEIRLIKLLPGSPENMEIVCQLIHVKTNTEKSQKPRYKALSYMWGPKEPRMMTLEGKHFIVRENLWQALYHIRLPERPVTIWIDALCINQDDASERSEQVSRMGLIYSRAEEVIIWLGLHDGDRSDAAMRALQRLYDTDSRLPDRREGGFSFFSQDEWNDINRLFRREYWIRIWIVQEVLRARQASIQCGFTRLGWNVFASFCRKVALEWTVRRRGNPVTYKARTLLLFTWTNAFKLHERKLISKSKQPLIDLLISTYFSISTDKLDRIFALMGLASDRFFATVSKGELPDFGRFRGCQDQRKWFVNYNQTPRDLFKNLLTYVAYFSRSYSSSGKTTARLSRTLASFLRYPEYDTEDAILDDKKAGVRIHADGVSTHIAAISTSFSQASLGPGRKEIFKWLERVSTEPLQSVEFRRINQELSMLKTRDLDRLRPTWILPGDPRLVEEYNGSNYESFMAAQRKQREHIQELEARISKGKVPANAKGQFKVVTTTRGPGVVPVTTKLSDTILCFQQTDAAVVLREIIPENLPQDFKLNTWEGGGYWTVIGRAMMVGKEFSNLHPGNASRYLISDRSPPLIAQGRDVFKLYLLPREWMELTW